MTVAANQPYFMPWIGYFQLMRAADVFVVSDDFNFIKRGWINRNNLLMSDGRAGMFTLKVKDKSDSRFICEHEYADDFSNLRQRLEHNYCRAPFYDETMTLIADILDTAYKNVARLNARSMEFTARHLGLATRFVLSSELDYDHTLRKEAKTIAINKALGADVYVNAIGGRELYSREHFRAEGIELKFLESLQEAYPQQYGREWVPYLSIIDVLMNCGREKTSQMLDNYRLI